MASALRHHDTKFCQISDEKFQKGTINKYKLTTIKPKHGTLALVLQAQRTMSQGRLWLCTLNNPDENKDPDAVLNSIYATMGADYCVG